MKCIIHIGTEKTGTTSLQSSLKQSRESLKSEGVLFPTSVGFSNHVDLYAYALSESKKEVLRERRLKENDVDISGFRRLVSERLGSEIKKNERCSTVVFSNEHLHSRLTSCEEVLALKDLLSTYFESILVVVYLRRQDRVAISRFSTHLRGGKRTFGALLSANEEAELYYDYGQLLDRYSKVFGENSIRVHVYEEASVEVGGVAGHFSRTYLEGAAKLVELSGKSSNRALCVEAQIVLAKINSINFLRSNVDEGKALLLKCIESLEQHEGDSLGLSRSDAKKFVERFERGNSEVARRFLKKECLFDADYSAYPVSVSENISSKKLTEISEGIFSVLVSNYKNSISELYYHKALLAKAEGNVEVAKTLLREAISLDEAGLLHAKFRNTLNSWV